MKKIMYSIPKRLTKFLEWKEKPVQLIDNVIKVEKFHDFNHLVDINLMFSNNPKGQPLDRTGKIHLPLKFDTGRPWSHSDRACSLADIFARRVNNLSSVGCQINLLWSGGIDSTTMVNSFLANTTDQSQLRVLYSPFSVYEHREYIETFLPQFSQVELVDISGDVYLTQQFDGIFVTGDTGDETHASIDGSFLETFGHEALFKSWKDFFYQKNPNTKFIDFCEEYFSWAGRPIDTVLEARWWYYINSKMYCNLATKLSFFADYENFNPNRLHGFFDFDEFDHYMCHNTDRIIASSDYVTWKQDLKDYCRSVDGFDNWAKEKTKTDSFQFHAYTYKKILLKDLRPIFILDDGTHIRTPSLPLLSRREFDRVYGNSLDYLLNDSL